MVTRYSLGKCGPYCFLVVVVGVGGGGDFVNWVSFLVGHLIHVIKHNIGKHLNLDFIWQ